MHINVILKNGDIKVNTDDIKKIVNILDNVKTKYPEALKSDIDYIDFFKDKYIKLNELRETEREYYNYIKKLDMLQENKENNSFRNDLQKKYDDFRNRRINLQNEIKNIEKNKYWNLY